MLLLFTVGEDRFGLDVRHVIEVIPHVNLKRLPKTPDYVAGLFNYRSVAVPVIDVSKMISGDTVRRHLSTRIIVVDYPYGGGGKHMLGLLAEHVTETAKFARSSFISSGRGAQSAEFLGELAMDEKGMVQCIRLDKLLPADLRNTLFSPLEDEKIQAEAGR